VQKGLPRIYLWAAILAAVVLFVIVWPPKYLRRRPGDARVAITASYMQLVRATRWLNLEPQGGQTPGEYLAFLAAALEERGRFAGEVAHDIGIIGHSYQLACYSRRDLTAADTDRVAGAWARLRPRLWRAWFARPKRGEMA